MIITFISLVIWLIYLVSLFYAVFWLLVFLEKGLGVESKNNISSYPNVSIAIPAYNEENTILKTLTSVINLNYPKNKMEIFVINDGSIDDTERIVKNFIDNNKNLNVNLINQENCGKGAALNVALKNAKGDLFICLDADSVVDRNALMDIIPEFVDEDVGAVLPMMRVNNPKRLIEKLQWFEYLLSFFYRRLTGQLNCIHVTPGPFGSYRRKVLLDLGGFDTNNLTEDLEIALRLQKNNYKIVQSTSSFVHTVAPATFVSFYKQRRRWYKGILFNLLFKHRDFLFNKKYGDLGMIQLPVIVLSGFLTLLLSFILLQNAIVPFFSRIISLSSIHFDYGFLFREFINNFTFLDISLMNLVLFGTLFSLAVFVFFLSHKYTKEKPLKFGIFTLIPYIIIYPLMLYLVWVGVFFELLFGINGRW